jgi:tetratricopeptide (TPR) repeat protein
MARTAGIVRAVQLVAILGIVVLLGAIGYQLLGRDFSTPRNELERAQFAAEEAVRANPEDPSARVKLAAAYLESKSPAAALEQAEIAIRLRPDDPTGYYIKGMTLNALGRSDEGIEALTKAAETKGQLAPFYQDVWVALSRAQEAEGLDEEALFSMSRALNFGPENVVLLYERGALYERLENWEFALEDYAAALEYVPNYGPALAAFTRVKDAHPDIFKMLQERYNLETTTTPTP